MNAYYNGLRIECNVTYSCNVKCDHCNKAVGMMKFRDGDMTVDQMRRAIDMIIDQKVKVKRFTFCGGEPIMHPDLQGLIDEADRIPRVRAGFRLLSNGLTSTQDRRDAIRLPKRFMWVINLNPARIVRKQRVM